MNACSHFEEMPGHPRTCWACGAPKRDHKQPPVVLEVAGLEMEVSPDFDAYASGAVPLAEVRCVLCGTAPCQCPPFGSPDFMELINRLHTQR